MLCEKNLLKSLDKKKNNLFLNVTSEEFFAASTKVNVPSTAKQYIDLIHTVFIACNPKPCICASKVPVLKTNEGALSLVPIYFEMFSFF